MLDSFKFNLLSKRRLLFNYYKLQAEARYYKFQNSRHLNSIDEIFAVSKSIPYEIGDIG
jgi:hypothetical protein